MNLNRIKFKLIAAYLALLLSMPAIGQNNLAPTEFDADALLARSSARAETQQLHQNHIEHLRQEKDTYDPELGEALEAMADFLIEGEEFVAALELLQETMHIRRVNEGLLAISQTPLVLKIVDSYLALEAWEEVEEWLQYYHYLQRQNLTPGDPEWANVYFTLATWYDFRFARNLIPEDTPNDPYYNDPGMIRISYLLQAQRWYTLTSLSLHAHQDPDHRQVSSLDRQIINNFYDMSLLDPTRSSAFSQGLNFYMGRARLISDSPLATAQQKASAWLNVADWYLLYKRYQSAREYYKQAYEWLVNAEVSQEQQEQFLNPIQAIPEEYAFPYVINPDTPTSAFVDVSLSISRVGNAYNIDLQPTPETPTEILDQLNDIRNFIVKFQFRPRLEHGEPVARENIRIRVALASSADPG